jgi:hypothetical protein
MPKTFTPEVGGFLLFALALLVLATTGGMRIATKAGYPSWVSLLFFVPVVDLVVLLVVAFSKWPVQRRLEQAVSRRYSGQAFASSGASPAFAGQAGQSGSWGRAQFPCSILGPAQKGAVAQPGGVTGASSPTPTRASLTEHAGSLKPLC